MGDLPALFGDWLRAHGVVLRRAPAMNGRWQSGRFEGQRDGASASFRAWTDGRPNGQLRDHRTGITTRWEPNLPCRRYDPAQLAAKQAERDRERRETEERAARYANWIIARSKPASADHPYLVRKGVDPEGLFDIRGNLIVPMRDAEGRIRNVQTIYPDGTKLFLKGAIKTGLYAMFGEVVDRVAVAEGVSTAKSVKDIFNAPTAAAFDAGNLLPVARSLRAQFPKAEIIIAGDDDQHLVERDLPNVGIVKATEAAKAVGGRVEIPPAPFKDWNDARTHAVQQLPPAPVPASHRSS
jgi:putative DNA primase/helicase